MFLNDPAAPVAGAVRALRRAADQHEKARARLHAAIAAASAAGVPQVELVRLTGYTRERIRQIVRDNAPPPRRDTGS